jgi:cobalt-zinc-cadmium efflux system protein
MAHDHSHHEHVPATRNLAAAFWLNTAFALVEIVGGLWTNSVAILSDALHDLGDSLSLGVAWYLQRKSRQGRSDRFTYGYRRFSLLGAVITALVLVVGSVFVIREAIDRLANPVSPDARGMVLLALLGIAVNGAALLRLRRGDSATERVVSLHFWEDVLGWVAVLVGAVVMTFADVPVLDPLLSLGIAVFVLINVYRNLKGTFGILLQAVPEGLSEAGLCAAIRAVPGVSDVHDVHLWTLDGRYHVASLHVVVPGNAVLDAHEPLKQAIREAAARQSVQHVTIELECEGTVHADPDHGLSSPPGDHHGHAH